MHGVTTNEVVTNGVATNEDTTFTERVKNAGIKITGEETQSGRYGTFLKPQSGRYGTFSSPS